MTSSNYQQCSRCIMDTSAEDIWFDDDGICSYCHNFDNDIAPNWHPGDDGKKIWHDLVQKIKRERGNREYDCILGMSGGVDSSYLALKLYEAGLKPLVVHVDAGWNSELAVVNIEKVIDFCEFDLHTVVVDWEAVRSLQLAYLKSGVANQDVPQDHVFFATLYHFATKNGLRYIMSGGNIATEGVYPKVWQGAAMDALNLKDINKIYGNRSLKGYRTVSFFQAYIWFPFIKKMRTIRPLNYMPFVKADALRELQEKTGYVPYDRKHGESLFTKFFQNYYLPTKFGYDKRLPHYSSLILSGQMSKDEALVKMKEPLYDSLELENDTNYLCKKLQINRSEFEDLLSCEIHHYSDFKNWDFYYRSLKKVQAVIERLLGKRIKIFS